MDWFLFLGEDDERFVRGVRRLWSLDFKELPGLLNPRKSRD
jgi:hypothetical protein